MQLIQDQAKVKKLAMQAELSLDIEMALPEPARKWLRLVVGKSKMRPNEIANWKLMHKFGKYFNGPLSSQRIAAAIFKDIVSFLGINIRVKRQGFSHSVKIARMF